MIKFLIVLLATISYADTPPIIYQFNSPLVKTSGRIVSCNVASGSQAGCLSSTDWSTFNGKQNALSLPLSISNGGTGQSTANSAFNALAPSQTGNAGFFLQTNGTDTSWAAVSGGNLPSAVSTTLVGTTSATTTFVTALTTTITVTASSAPIKANCVLDVTSATSASVAGTRVTINAVAGGTVTESLTTATTQHLTIPNQYLSANLGPGTYTVTCDFNRTSGTGTVTVGAGSLHAIVLQGANSNGITSLSGLGLSAGPGSGAQSLTGVLTLAGGGTNANNTAVNGGIVYSSASALNISAAGSTGQILRSAGAATPTWTSETFPASTTINQILYSSAANVVSGLATANTGALVTSSTGVPSITSGAVANRLLRTNGTTVSFAQAGLTTDVTGILPGANGGTGTTMFAANRIPFSNGTTYAADALFIYNPATNQFTVGNGAGTGKISSVVLTTDPSPNLIAGNFFSRTTGNVAVEIQNENTLATLDMTNSGGTAIGANIFAEASRGTLAARTQTQSGDLLFSLTAHGRTASAWSLGTGATMGIVATEAVTDTTNGAEIFFSTTPNGGAASTERLRIKQSGETQLSDSHLKSIQTTAPIATVNPNAGTGATCTLNSGATDQSFIMTLTFGSGSFSSGSQCDVAFNKPMAAAIPCVCSPRDANSAGDFGGNHKVYTDSSTTTLHLNYGLAQNSSGLVTIWNCMCPFETN